MWIFTLIQTSNLYVFPHSNTPVEKLQTCLCFPILYIFYYLGGAVVSGWGTLYSGGPSVSHLRDLDVNVFPNGDCGSMNSEMDETMICAGYMDGGKVNYEHNITLR